MRTLFGIGTPRGLQGRAAALLMTLWSLIWHPKTACTTIGPDTDVRRHRSTYTCFRDARRMRSVLVEAFATGC